MLDPTAKAREVLRANWHLDRLPSEIAAALQAAYDQGRREQAERDAEIVQRESYLGPEAGGCEGCEDGWCQSAVDAVCEARNRVATAIRAQFERSER